MSDPQTPVPAADLLVRRLADHGVRRVFGYPGGQLTPIYDALYRQSTIRHVLARARTGGGVHGRRLRPRHRPARRLPGGVRPRRLQRRHAAVGRLHRLDRRCCSSAARSPTPAAASAPATTTKTTSSPPAPRWTKYARPGRFRGSPRADARPLLGRADARPAGAGPPARCRWTCCGPRRRPGRGRRRPPPPRPLAPPAGSVEALARLVVGMAAAAAAGRRRSRLRRGGDGAAAGRPSSWGRRSFTRRWASAPCRPTTRWRPACPGGGPPPT